MQPAAGVLAAAGGAQQAQAATRQVKMCGLVPARSEANVQLAQVLRGMCHEYVTLSIKQYGWAAPIAGGARQAQIKLTTQLVNNVPSNTWKLTHEAPPITGPDAQAAPAIMQEVSSSNLYCNNANELLRAMGLQYEYYVVRQGNLYLCQHEGYEVTVVYGQMKRGRMPQHDLLQGHLLVEATITVAGDASGMAKCLAAARALGSFADRLLPMVQLRKP